MIYLYSCDVCGTLNFRENSYCTHCGNKLVFDHVCPYCGKSNVDNASYCVHCGKQINPVTIDDFDVLFSQYNMDLLLNAEISDEDYNGLLSNIFLRAQYSEIYGSTPKEKIINFASIFTKCIPKSRGYERGSNFFGTVIFYDDRLDESTQIATIIHELAHYLLFAIIESLLCYIFKVKSSSTLQSFVWYFLTLPEFRIMNEYCAHTVEGRFVPFGYQNYGSFNVLVENSDYDEEYLDEMIAFGNTFANEIIIYLEKFIDDDLRNEIKLQYKKDLINPKYDSMLRECDASIPLNLKNRHLIKILYQVLNISSNEDEIKELVYLKEAIESF